MGFDNLVSLVPLISIAVTAGLAIFTWWASRGTQKADAASTLTGSALGLVEALTKRVDDLEVDLAAEREKRLALQHTIEEQGALIMQLRGRIQTLEAENGRLKKENHELKSAGSNSRF